MTPEQLDKLRYYLGEAISIDHLSRREWRLQTDLLRQSFIAADMFVQLDKRAIFVDGRISVDVGKRALASKDVKAFFNRRCHDFGLKSRRLIYFDTVSSAKIRGGNHNTLLHFHALLEFPERRSLKQFKAQLKKVFGDAKELGERQLHRSAPNWDTGFTHGSTRAQGPLGKIFYSTKNAGAAYAALNLNKGGARSRAAPVARGSLNKRSQGIAKGLPSNFNAQIVICDRASQQRGRAAFNAWYQDEKAKQDRQILERAAKAAPTTANESAAFVSQAPLKISGSKVA